MSIFRNILKLTLQFLARLAIKKHNIKFIVVAGWYDTDIVKEGIYSVLSDKLKIRKNTKKIWWDLSIPLIILGLVDKRRNLFWWFYVLLKSFLSLIFIQKNTKHYIVLSVNMGNKDIVDYWSKLVVPELLIVTSYKEEKSELIDMLAENTKYNGGKRLINTEIKSEKFQGFSTYGYTLGKENHIITPNGKYKANKDLNKLILRTYAPVIAAAEYYNWSEEEILSALSKFCVIEEIFQDVLEKMKCDIE